MRIIRFFTKIINYNIYLDPVLLSFSFSFIIYKNYTMKVDLSIVDMPAPRDFFFNTSLVAFVFSIVNLLAAVAYIKLVVYT